jgi:hypothetical protein
MSDKSTKIPDDTMIGLTAVLGRLAQIDRILCDLNADDSGERCKCVDIHRHTINVLSDMATLLVSDAYVYKSVLENTSKQIPNSTKVAASKRVASFMNPVTASNASVGLPTVQTPGPPSTQAKAPSTSKSVLSSLFEDDTPPDSYTPKQVTNRLPLPPKPISTSKVEGSRVPFSLAGAFESPAVQKKPQPKIQTNKTPRVSRDVSKTIVPVSPSMVAVSKTASTPQRRTGINAGDPKRVMSTHLETPPRQPIPTKATIGAVSEILHQKRYRSCCA